MKLIIAVLGLINGGYMLIDGIYVVLNKKFIGPKKPGLWSEIFTSFGINILKLGPVFTTYGILWLIWVYALWTNQNWSYFFGVIMCIISLWYLPIGTLFSLIILCILLKFKYKLII